MFVIFAVLLAFLLISCFEGRIGQTTGYKRARHIFVVSFWGVFVGTLFSCLIGTAFHQERWETSAVQKKKQTLISLDRRDKIEGSFFLASFFGFGSGSGSVDTSETFYFYYEVGPNAFKRANIKADDDVTIHEEDRSGGELVVLAQKHCAYVSELHLGYFVIYGSPGKDIEYCSYSDEETHIYIPKGSITRGFHP